MKQLALVLLVDDNPADNYIHQRILARAHCAAQVEVALNGQEGIDFLQRRKAEGLPLPDLVFLDINMPVLDGWGFLDKCRELNFDADTMPIIAMLTTSLNPRDVARARESGLVEQYIEKPLTVDGLEFIMSRIYPEDPN